MNGTKRDCWPRCHDNLVLFFYVFERKESCWYINNTFFGSSYICVTYSRLCLSGRIKLLSTRQMYFLLNFFCPFFSFSFFRYLRTLDFSRKKGRCNGTYTNLTWPSFSYPPPADLALHASVWWACGSRVTGVKTHALFFFFFFCPSRRDVSSLHDNCTVSRMWIGSISTTKIESERGFLKNGRTFANWEKNNKEKVWPVFLFLSFFTVFKPVKKKKRGGEGRNEFWFER